MTFACQECGRKFKTTKAAEKAAWNGCPKCGGSDIDLAPVPATAWAKAAARRGPGALPSGPWRATTTMEG